MEGINKTVGKRSVYSQDELKSFEGENLVILFIQPKSWRCCLRTGKLNFMLK